MSFLIVFIDIIRFNSKYNKEAIDIVPSFCSEISLSKFKKCEVKYIFERDISVNLRP